MMPRPSDWGALGLSHDPAPGDANVVRAGGQQYTSTADALARAAVMIRGLSSGASHDSLSVKALMEQAGDLDRDLSRAEGRYRVAGTALTGYATVLSRVQGSTYTALYAARRNRSDAATDRSMALKWRRLAQQSLDDAERASYERAAAKSLQDAADHDRVVTLHRQQVAGWSQELDQAADRAAQQIEDAQAADGLDDTWWEDWGSKFFNILAEVAEKIAMIAGLLALLFAWFPPLGAFFLAVSAIAGIVAAIANIVLAAKGEKSWTAALASILFAVVGCIGLGGLRGILGALKGITAAFKGAAWITAGTKTLAGFRGLVTAGTRVIVATLKPISSNLRLFHTVLGNLARRVLPGSRDWARFSGILRDAARGKGNFGLGSPVSRRDAKILGRAWIGKGARRSSNGKAWISKDGLRQWRPPKFKKHEKVWRSNLEARWVPNGKWQCNGHLDIIGR